MRHPIYIQALLSLLIACMPYYNFAQIIDTVAVYKKARRAPARVCKSPSQLAEYLTQHYSDDARKVLAMSYWICKNIKYNYKAFKERSIIGNNSTTVLKKRKALCGEYATLFKEMCAAVNIRAEVVSGYTRDFDFFEQDTLFRAEHAWSAVCINGHWKLLDLTYASGYIKAKKQGLKRFLARTFHIPYTPQFKFVQHFQPSWLWVAPDELILTHFPNIDAFQLLKTPVSLKSYRAGTWSVYSHLAWHWETLSQSPALDIYSNQSTIQKWLDEGDIGHGNNPYNHRIKGFNYFRALDSLTRASWNPEKKQLNISFTQLERLERYFSIADSMLHYNIKDNAAEYKMKQQHSSAWKRRLFSNNQQYQKALHASENSYKKQQSRSHTLLQYKLTQIRGTSECINSLRPQHEYIHSTPRPRSSNKAKPNIAQGYLNQADSLGLIITKLFENKDSLLSYYTQNPLITVTYKEKQLLKLQYKKHKHLQAMINVFAANMPYIHTSTEHLDKVWFAQQQLIMDSLTMVDIESVLVRALHDYKYWYKDLKKAYSTTNKQLRLLQKVKRHSNKDLQEDQLYTEAIKNCLDQLDAYSSYLKLTPPFAKKLRRLLQRDINLANQDIRQFEKDKQLEQNRHQAYMIYRQSIKNAENNRTRFMLKQLSTIKSYLNKTRKRLEEANNNTTNG